MINFTLKLCLAFGFSLMAGSAFATDLTGAGASFPAPIYKKWAESYGRDAGLNMSYLPYGSGEGINRIQAKSVDFGASDKPLTPDELEKAGLVQFPTLVGGVVPVVNVAGIGANKLNLDGQTLAAIYLGKITKWNDAAIAALNPDVKLPNAEIAVVTRADNSGTTFIFTNYLSKVSPEWKSTVGEGTTVSWKVGKGCRGNVMMPLCIIQTSNSIGFIEYAYAVKNLMSMVRMKNQAGQFVAASDAGFKEAAAHAKWNAASGFYEVLTDQPGNDSWPLTGATFILMNRVQDKPENAKNVLKFFDWAYTKGDVMAVELGYVPLPDTVEQLVRETWITQVNDANGKAGATLVRK